ncbi:hypothetical protein OsJ_34068 [Oryza sativa Japonica Group]|uniref:Uncharacterized protein n=1 Tax=Oryza sativa subsp. japonica TaxID=39947 RepID=B9GAY5_ORYSJ|nr:hypothetical protein OsJ_34068 [Oryza sativa Japonica Group]
MLATLFLSSAGVEPSSSTLAPCELVGQRKCDALVKKPKRLGIGIWEGRGKVEGCPRRSSPSSPSQDLEKDEGGGDEKGVLLGEREPTSLHHHHRCHRRYLAARASSSTLATTTGTKPLSTSRKTKSGGRSDGEDDAGRD